MGRLIDADVLREEVYSWGMNDYEPSDFTDAIDDAPTVEAIPKDQYEARLKADLKAILVELQLEIKELWDNRYDVWLDNQYYIGKSDTLDEVDDVIQQKINALRGEKDE